MTLVVKINYTLQRMEFFCQWLWEWTRIKPFDKRKLLQKRKRNLRKSGGNVNNLHPGTASSGARTQRKQEGQTEKSDESSEQ